MHRTLLILVLILGLGKHACAEPTLVGFARLAPDTFRPGPTSGQFLSPDADLHGRKAPFEDKQPVQGISSVVAGDKEGTFLALSDNGFGTKANSADYLLCVYRVTPDFITEEGGTGEVKWELAFHLSDPDQHVPWPIVAEGETYPDSDIPVPAEIREGRLLTGADFDVESMVRLPDGTFWMGDEFGPFLLHFDAEGRLLEPPVELPGEGMHSPDHPTKDPAMAKIGRSAGFEGMAMLSGGSVFPMLEKAMDNGGMVPFYFFVADGLPDKRVISDHLPPYPLEDGVSAIGEATWAPTDGPGGPIVIERDGGEGRRAKVKILTRGLMRPMPPEEMPDDPYGIAWQKTRLADLLDLADPHDLDGDGEKIFRFAFFTIESVLPVDERTVLVVNDNNYPLSSGRTEGGEGEPDPTEFILIRFDKPLSELP